MESVDMFLGEAGNVSGTVQQVKQCYLPPWFKKKNTFCQDLMDPYYTWLQIRLERDRLGE